MITAVEAPGDGELVHPTLGRVQVAVIGFDWEESGEGAGQHHRLPSSQLDAAGPAALPRRRSQMGRSAVGRAAIAASARRPPPRSPRRRWRRARGQALAQVNQADAAGRSLVGAGAAASATMRRASIKPGSDAAGPIRAPARARVGRCRRRDHPVDRQPDAAESRRDGRRRARSGGRSAHRQLVATSGQLSAALDAVPFTAAALAWPAPSADGRLDARRRAAGPGQSLAGIRARGRHGRRRRASSVVQGACADLFRRAAVSAMAVGELELSARSPVAMRRHGAQQVLCQRARRPRSRSAGDQFEDDVYTAMRCAIRAQVVRVIRNVAAAPSSRPS